MKTKKNTKKGPDVYAVNLRISKAEHAVVHECAEREERSVAAMTRLALSEYLRKHHAGEIPESVFNGPQVADPEQ